MRTSLVTGAGGFVGGAVAEALMRRGDRVVCVARSRRSLRHRPILLEANWAIGSVADEGFLRDVIARYEPQEVYHYAASAIVRSAERDPVGATRSNCVGTAMLLAACKSVGDIGAILVASTDKVYGEPDHAVSEDDALRPAHVYDASKAGADFVAQACAEDLQLPVVITRSCNIYGPGDLNFGRVIPAVCQALVDRKPPVIHQGAEAMEREFVYVDDYVEAALHLTASIRTLRHRTFNVGTGEVRKVASVIRDLIAASGLSIEPEVRAASFRELASQSVNAERLRATGWAPKVLLAEGLARSWHWYSDFLGGEH